MNTEPDEYYCACPQGYSGKDCQIGQGLDMRLPFSYIYLGMCRVLDTRRRMSGHGAALFSPTSRARLRFRSLRQRRHVSRGPRRLRVSLSAGLGGSDLRYQ